jgi:hypothetical protein
LKKLARAISAYPLLYLGVEKTVQRWDAITSQVRALVVGIAPSPRAGNGANGMVK